jgi:hypothetical protein
MDFHSTRVFSVMKADNRTIFAVGDIINRKTHHNSLCGDKNKHYVTSYVTLSRMRELSPTPTLIA